MNEIRIEGLRELERALLDLPAAVTRRVVRGAVAAGARMVRNEVKRSIPVRTGALKANVYMRRAKADREMTTYEVSIRTKAAKYGNTKTNRRLGRVGQSYKQEKTWYWRVLEFGSKRGHKRNEYIQRAFQRTQRQAAQAIAEGLQKGVEREAARVGRRGG
jgi:HK97 gp10 family phage protein